MNHLSRVSRLVHLLGLLQASKGQNASALAKACNVTRRTIFRDLVVLREAGVPLLFDDEHGSYRIPGTYFLPPTNFTAEEALTLIVLCNELGGRRKLPFYHAAHQAALKLESSLPTGMREQLRDATAAVQINLPPISRLDESTPIYQQLLSCIAARQSVRIRYDSFSEKGPLRLKLNPYRLLFSRHSWYVIGRSALHREVRTFNVGRIQSLELTDESFEIPRGFSIDRYLGNAWHLIPESGPDQDVVVRFRPLVARNVAEVLWHKTQRVVQREDGSVDLHVRVSGVREISWWILGYGDQAEVLEPDDLRQIIAERASQLVKLYNGRATQAPFAWPPRAWRFPTLRVLANMFFSFDGLDGVGKSTQINRFETWLRTFGHDVVTCQDPGSTPLGEAIREILLGRRVAINRTSEMLLFMAARAQLVDEVIQPALTAGKTVVSDRYLLANVVYQGHAGGLDVETIKRIGREATRGVMPDMVFLLDMPVESAADRIARPLDHMERQGTNYQAKLREGFLAESKLDPERIKVIDASRAIDVVEAEIRAAAEPLLRRD